MAWHGHMTDGDYTDSLSQSFCLSSLCFGSGFGPGLSKIVLYIILKCQTSMNMSFNNNTFNDKLVGQKQIFLHGKKPEKVVTLSCAVKKFYPLFSVAAS